MLGANSFVFAKIFSPSEAIPEPGYSRGLLVLQASLLQTLEIMVGAGLGPARPCGQVKNLSLR